MYTPEIPEYFSLSGGGMGTALAKFSCAQRGYTVGGLKTSGKRDSEAPANDAGHEPSR